MHPDASMEFSFAQQLKQDNKKTNLCGFMLKLAAKGIIKTWKRRYFELNVNDNKVFYKAKINSEIINSIELDVQTVIRSCIDLQSNHKYSGCFFCIKNPGRTYFLASETKLEKENWMTGLDTYLRLLYPNKKLSFIGTPLHLETDDKKEKEKIEDESIIIKKEKRMTVLEVKTAMENIRFAVYIYIIN